MLAYMPAPSSGIYILQTINFLNCSTPMTALFLLAATIMFISGLYDANKTKNTWLFFQKIPLSAAVWMLGGHRLFLC
jgi:predicted membrane-bound dolichyl-phosphate-mannose-protein mannosyltransferase